MTTVVRKRTANSIINSNIIALTRFLSDFEAFSFSYSVSFDFLSWFSGLWGEKAKETCLKGGILKNQHRVVRVQSISVLSGLVILTSLWEPVICRVQYYRIKRHLLNEGMVLTSYFKKPKPHPRDNQTDWLLSTLNWKPLYMTLLYGKLVLR